MSLTQLLQHDLTGMEGTEVVAYLAPGRAHNAIADRPGPIKLLVSEIHEKDHWMTVPAQ